MSSQLREKEMSRRHLCLDGSRMSMIASPPAGGKTTGTATGKQIRIFAEVRP